MKFVSKAVEPFDFDLSVRIFSDGDKQIRRYESGRYWQVVRVGKKLVLIVVKSLGTVDEPKISVELKSNEEISYREKKIIREIVDSIFSMRFDLKAFYKHVEKDRVMSRIVQKLRGLKAPATETVFEALIDSITEQQISLKVSQTLERKLIKTFGDVLELDGEVYYGFPTPKKLASASVEELHGCGLSLRKAEYIKDLSAMIVDGKLNLEELKNRDAKEIVSELCEIRGIGVWTAELTMVRGMNKVDALPADDLGLRRVISHFYCGGREISAEEARRIAEKWGRWKGLAGGYLIFAEMLGAGN